MVLHGPTTPRHVRMGLAVFTIAFAGARDPPKMLQHRAPLLQVAAATPMSFDAGAEDAMKFAVLMQGPVAQGATWRNPRGSPARAAVSCGFG